MVENHRPAEPVVDDKGKTYGGFAEVAQLLNKLFPKRERPISRQLVYKWWEYRVENQFPEATGVAGTSNGGRGCSKFSYAEVVAWYIDKRQYRDELRYIRSGASIIFPTPGHSATDSGEDSLAA